MNVLDARVKALPLINTIDTSIIAISIGYTARQQ